MIMNKIKVAFLSVIVFTVFLFVAWLTYTFVEPKAYDFMISKVSTERLPFDNTKNIYGHDDIVLVVIDNKSIERYRWPWKRDLNCKIFEYFSEYAKPKVFVHDAILTTLDTEAPEADAKYFKTLKETNNLVEGFMYDLKYENAKFGEKYDKEFTSKYGLKEKCEGRNNITPNIWSNDTFSSGVFELCKKYRFYNNNPRIYKWKSR